MYAVNKDIAQIVGSPQSASETPNGGNSFADHIAINRKLMKLGKQNKDVSGLLEVVREHGGGFDTVNCATAVNL